MSHPNPNQRDQLAAPHQPRATQERRAANGGAAAGYVPPRRRRRSDAFAAFQQPPLSWG